MKQSDWLRDSLTCRECGRGLILIANQFVACQVFDHMRQVPTNSFLSTIEHKRKKNKCKRARASIRRLATRVLSANADRFASLLNPPVASSSPACHASPGLFDSASNQEPN